MEPERASWRHRRLYRSRKERMFRGVAGGLAEHVGVDPTLVRLLFVVLAIFGQGIGVLAYVLLWIVVPQGPAATDVSVDDLPRSAADIPPQPPSWAE